MPKETPLVIDSATVEAGELVVLADGGNTRWSVPGLQIEKHLPQFVGGMKAGDLSAARDAAADAAKEYAKRGA